MRGRVGSPLPKKIRAERVHIIDVLLFKYDQDAECEDEGGGARRERDAHWFGEEIAR